MWIADFKQDVLELRVKNMLKTEVCFVYNTPPKDSMAKDHSYFSSHSRWA